MTKTRTLICGLLLIGGSAAAEDGYGPLIMHGIDEEVAIGADLFFSETFGGNGRTCATCHFADANYTLPADLTGISDQDPLMIADPDNPAFVAELELCDPLDGSEDCQAIRQNGLILVNADGHNTAPDGFRSYSMRSVPHLLSLPTTLDTGGQNPGEATGWSGDGSPDLTLHGFAAGAFEQHFTLDTARMAGDFPVPTVAEADAMLAFQLGLGRSSSTDIGPIAFRDDRAQDGDALFREGRRCSICHALGGEMPNPLNFNLDTHVEEARMAGCPDPTSPGKCRAASAALVPGANFDGGNGTAPYLNGRFGDGKFNVPALIEAADTGPFFHDNSALKLEPAIAHYRSTHFEDGYCPAGQGLECGLIGTTPGLPERELGAFLRILNAGLNLAMGAQRLEFARELITTEPGTAAPVIALLELARAEIADARTVIDDVQFEIADGGDGLDVFDDTGGHLTDARSELDQILTGLDTQIAGGTSNLQLVSSIAMLIAVANDHLADDFHDSTSTACGSPNPPAGALDPCRWIFDLGEGNLLFDNRGVTPDVIANQADASWTPNPGGTATVSVTWKTASWSNRLLDAAVLTDISPNPTQSTLATVGTGTTTQLANGDYEHTLSFDIDCVAGAKYRLDVTSRVGGNSESDSDTVKAGKYCIGP